jgi:hypothetical protein
MREIVWKKRKERRERREKREKKRDNREENCPRVTAEWVLCG